MKQLLFFILFTSFLVSCGDQKIDTTKARLEMESREIKRISEGEIVEKALAIGNDISNELTIEKDPALGFMIHPLNQETKSVSLLTFKNLQSWSGGGKRAQIYDAYLYNAENNIASETNVQILEGDTSILYTRPAYLRRHPDRHL
jgi:hypothetical protein